MSKPLDSQSKSVPDWFVSSSHSKDVAQFVVEALGSENLSPKSLLEVGPALGRNCYELITSIPSINSATLVEPSHRFLSNLKQLLMDGGECDFHYIKSLKEQKYLGVDLLERRFFR